MSRDSYGWFVSSVSQSNVCLSIKYIFTLQPVPGLRTSSVLTSDTSLYQRSFKYHGIQYINTISVQIIRIYWPYKTKCCFMSPACPEQRNRRSAGTCARDRRALQQLVLNVHVKRSDLMSPVKSFDNISCPVADLEQKIKGVFGWIRMASHTIHPPPPTPDPPLLSYMSPKGFV